VELESASKILKNQQIRKEGKLLYTKENVKGELQKVSQKFVEKYIQSRESPLRLT